MKKLAIATALLSTLAIAGTANAYQTEVGASAGFIDPDQGSSSGSYSVNGTYYFNPVQVGSAPLAEAAFLSHSSNVDLSYLYADVGDDRSHHYSLSGEYFVPNSKFYGSASIGRQDVKRKGMADNNTTLYRAEAGYLILPSFLIAAGVTGYDNDFNDGADPTIRAKYFTTLASGNDINLEGSASFGDLDEYYLGADYYLNKTFSVGADYYDNDLTTESEFGIKARKFFNPQMSVEGRVGFGEIGNNDYKSFDVGLKYRF